MNRLILNKTILILSTLAAVIGVGFLFWILITLSYKGIMAIHWTTFTHDLVEGGIRNLLVGQFIMAILCFCHSGRPFWRVQWLCRNRCAGYYDDPYHYFHNRQYAGAGTSGAA